MTVAQVDASRGADPVVDLDAIIGTGAHYLLNDHAMKDELMAKIEAAFLGGIEKYHGKAARDAVARDGLRMVHKHFPVEKVKLLEHHLLEELRDLLYYWSYRVGAENIGIEGEFFVDHLIVIRIHYPHLVARKARPQDIVKAPFPWTERLRLVGAALKNPKMLVYAGSRAVAKKLEARRKTKSHDYDAAKTHGNIATPARAHGAHVDTWYGHSYDGINLWLSIDGVNEGNTVILYPELWGQEVRFNPVSMYLAEGQATPRPLKYAMRPGELLVFNPEMLHGTQVNISDETRVALTTRLNPDRPRFAAEAPFHFEYWYSSKDLARKNWGRMSVFPHKEYQGKPSWTSGAPLRHETTRRIELPAGPETDAPVDVCASEELTPGLRLAVDAGRAKLMLWRTEAGIRAWSRLCPHMGIDTLDGFQDGREVFCPGHGMAFSVETGKSDCEAFRLRQFRAWEENGRVLVAKGE